MLIRFSKAFIGFILMLIRVRILNFRKLFKNKRVAVIGPADSAYHKQNGLFIDSFDFVIRINKSILVKDDSKNNFIGAKTDILFHNFYENTDKGGGGPLDLNLFHKHGLKFLVQPRNNYEGWRNILNFYKKYISLKEIYAFSKLDYAEIEKYFNPLKPTMGICALFAALSSNSNEVFVSGFTFFKTPYSKGYRDHLLDLSENEKHIKNQGQHSPEMEYQFFKLLLRKSNASKIILDNKLFEILESENFEFTPMIVNNEN